MCDIRKCKTFCKFGDVLCSSDAKFLCANKHKSLETNAFNSEIKNVILDQATGNYST